MNAEVNDCIVSLIGEFKRATKQQIQEFAGQSAKNAQLIQYIMQLDIDKSKQIQSWVGLTEPTGPQPQPQITDIAAMLKQIISAKNIIEEKTHVFNGVDLADASKIAAPFAIFRTIIIPISELNNAISAINSRLNRHKFDIYYKKMGDYVLIQAEKPN